MKPDKEKTINKACDEEMAGFREPYGVDSDPGLVWTIKRKVLSEQDKDNIIESVRHGG